MSDDLRHLLREEMAGQSRPPVDGLVAGAVQRGRRRRRARAVASTAGTATVVGVTVLAVAGTGLLSSGRGAGTAGAQAGTASTATMASTASPAAQPVASATAPGPSPVPASQVAVTSSPAVAVPAPVPTPTSAEQAAPGAGSKTDKMTAGKVWTALQLAATKANPPHWAAAPSGVPATPQGELQLFAELAKPYGTTSNQAVSEDSDKTHVRAYLTTPDGRVGMLQFQLYKDTKGYDADCLPKPEWYLKQFAVDGPSTVTCRPRQDGGYVIEASYRSTCVTNDDITVVHPDGTAVWVNLATCLTSNSNSLSPGSQTLTTAQAEKIFSDPGFDLTMPADVVARGAALGNLPTFW